MQQHRQHLGVVIEIVADDLLRAHLAQNHRVDRLKVRGVGHQRHMHAHAVEFAIGAGAKVVFHVAGTCDVIGIGRATRKLVEDDAIRLGHDIGEHVEAAAMRHAVHDLLEALLSAIFDHGFQRRDHRFPAVEAEPLGADILLAQEVLERLGFDHLRQDRPLAVLGKLDGLVDTFHPVLEEAPLFDIRDMHVFQADLAAVIGAQRGDQLAHGRPVETHRAAKEHQLVQLGAGKPVVFRRQISGDFLLRQAQRVKIRRQMAAHPVGADQHHRADRSIGSACDRGFVDRLARRCRGTAHRSLDGRFHLHGVERRGQIIAIAQRPVAALPARARLGGFCRVEIKCVVGHKLPSL